MELSAVEVEVCIGQWELTAPFTTTKPQICGKNTARRKQGVARSCFIPFHLELRELGLYGAIALP